MVETIISCTTCQNTYDVSTAKPGETASCPICGTAAPQPIRSDELIGKDVAGYHIAAKIGEDSVAVTYCAEQISLCRPVIFKALKSKVDRTIFRWDAVAGARLAHPNIASVFDIAEIAGIPFIVMERINAPSLKQIMEASTGMPMPRTFAICRGILNALSSAHEQQLLHGNLKPKNIFVNADGSVKVSDFGLPPLLSEDSPESLYAACYLSPEYMLGDTCNVRSDIYSFGAILFEMLTDHPPFTGETMKEIANKIACESLPNITILNSAVPQRLVDLVTSMLSKSPGDRPSTPRAVLDELNAVEREADIDEKNAFTSADWNRAYGEAFAKKAADLSATSAEKPKRTRPSWPAVVALGISLIALAAASYAFWVLSATTSPIPKPQKESVSTITPPVQNELEKHAKLLYEEAEDYAQQNPYEYKNIIAKFQQVTRFGTTTSYADSAIRRIKEIRHRWEHDIETTLKAADAKAQNLMAAKRFSEALEALTLPENLRNPDLDAELKRMRDDVEGKFQQYYDKLYAIFTQKLAKDNFSSAEQAWAAMSALNFPNSQVKLTQLKATLKSRRQEANREWALDAKADILLLLKETNIRASQRNYDSAIDFVQKQIRNRYYSSIRSQLEQEQAGLIMTRDVIRKSLSYLAANQGIELQVRGILGTFTHIENDFVFIKAGSTEFNEPAKELHSKEIARLATATLKDSTEGARQLAIGVFLLYDQQLYSAEPLLKAAADNGQDVSYYMWRLRTFTGETLDYQEKIACAERALERMRMARRNADWRSVLNWAGELTQLSELPQVAQCQREIIGAANEAKRQLRLIAQ